MILENAVKNKRVYIGIFIFDFIFSLVVLLSKILFPIMWSGEKKATESWNVFKVQNIVIFMIVCVISYIVMIGIYEIANKINIKTNKKENIFKYGIVSFLMNISCWSIWFIVLFPGTGMNDTINCIMSPTESANMQPPVFEAVVYYGMKILMRIMNNSIVGYAIFTFIQMIIFSVILAWACTWLAKKQIKPIILYAIIIYNSLMPIVGNYSIAIIKDIWYSYAVLVCTLTIHDILNGKINEKIIWILFVLSAGGIFFLRSNGKIIVLFVIAIMIYKEKIRKMLLCIGISFLILNSLVTYTVKQYNNSNVTMREASGVLFCQMASVVYYDGKMDDESCQFMDRLLPIEDWRTSYRLSFADTIKFNENFDNEYLNENKVEFIKTWFRLLKNNFKLYVKAYLYHTYGLWNIGINIQPVDYTQSVFMKINNNTSDGVWVDFMNDIQLKNKSLLPQNIQKPMYALLERLAINNLKRGCGIFVWITLFLLYICILKKKIKTFISFMPLILSWGTMFLATPASMVLRYIFGFILMLPFTILICIMDCQKKDRVQEGRNNG